MKNVSINIFSKRLFAFYIIKVSTTRTSPTPHFPLSTSVIKTRLPFFDINFGRDTPFSKKNIPCHQHEVPAIEVVKAVNYFHKKLYHRCLTEFLIHQSIPL